MKETEDESAARLAECGSFTELLPEVYHQLRHLDLRFFAGLKQAEAAEQLEISRSTADRLWLLARSWLYARMRLPEDGGRARTPLRAASNAKGWEGGCGHDLRRRAAECAPYPIKFCEANRRFVALYQV